MAPKPRSGALMPDMPGGSARHRPDADGQPGQQLAERDGGQQEVDGVGRPGPDAEHAERRHPEDGCDRGARHDGQHETQPEVGDAHLHDHDGGGVAADPEEGGMAEAGDVRIAPDEVEARGEEPVDHHLADEARQPRGREERQQQHDHADDGYRREVRPREPPPRAGPRRSFGKTTAGDCRLGRRLLRPGAHQNTFLPMSPLGRRRSTARKTIQAKNSATCGMYALPNVSRSPMTRAPSMVPWM